MVIVSYKFSRSSSVVTSSLTSKMRDFFGRLSRSSDPARDIIATKDETELASLPPPYEELPRLLPSTELPLSVVHSLKRCLIWRMAIDLDLKWYVPRIERPSDKEYARFESCCEDYGKYLGDQFVSEESLRDVNDSLWLQIFLPGSKLGIPGGKYRPRRHYLLSYIVPVYSPLIYPDVSLQSTDSSKP
jgi:hypothetical protein